MTVALDLTHVVELSGRVELPEGEDATLARVVLDDGLHATEAEAVESYRDASLPGVAVDKTGAFRLTATSVPPPRLRAWHPWLRPAADGGAVVVADAKQPVTLRLERAPLVSFTPRLAGRTAPERMGVFLAPVPADGPEIRKCTAFLHDGALRFLAPEPANYTLLIDPGGSLAPVVRKETFTDSTSTSARSNSSGQHAARGDARAPGRVRAAHLPLRRRASTDRSTTGR